MTGDEPAALRAEHLSELFRDLIDSLGGEALSHTDLRLVLSPAAGYEAASAQQGTASAWTLTIQMGESGQMAVVEIVPSGAAELIIADVAP